VATIYPRGRAWYLQWTEDGRQRRQSLGPVPKTHAEQIRRDKELDLAAGTRLLPRRRRGVATLEEFAHHYLDWHAAEYPASHARVGSIVTLHLLPEYGHLPLDQIRAAVVEPWKARRLQEVRAATVIKELRTLRALIGRAIAWDWLDHDPLRGVRDPRDLTSRPPRWYSVSEMQAIYAADSAWRAVWQLIANTGLRRAEAQQLREEHVLADRIRILSEPGARTKSGRWRDVPLSPTARAALDTLTPRDGYLLARMAPWSVSRRFARTLDRAGLDGTLHSLRHTFCAHLVMGGVPLRTVQVLAGHASYATTERYAHLAPDHLARSAQLLDL
jgi:integrase